MELSRFEASPVGHLAPIAGTDAGGGSYEHAAFVAAPLSELPPLSGATWARVGAARAALGRLHQGARFVGNVALLRQPTLRREAQSTSALEGTFAPLEDVLAADVIERGNRSSALVEVLNFVSAAEHAFEWISHDRPLTVTLLCGVHKLLVSGTAADTDQAGRVRAIQVAIGSGGGRVEDARFIPMPPGVALDAAVTDLVTWINEMSTNRAVDPVVAAAITHYQFETLHPFNDGNGRIGRLMIVLQLLQSGVLPDSLLTVSPWFEQRRAHYQDALLEVSATGDWDRWVTFFADGLEASAIDTAHRIEAVLDVKEEFHTQLAAAGTRGGIARDIADYMISHPYQTVSQIAADLSRPYQSVKDAIEKLIVAGVVEDYANGSRRTVRAPKVLEAYR